MGPRPDLREVRRALGFCGDVLRQAFRGWSGKVRAVVFLGAFSAVAVRQVFGYEVKIVAMGPDGLLIAIALAVLGWGLLRAPYQVYAEERARGDSLEAERDALRRRLDERDKNRQLAAIFAELHEHGAALRRAWLKGRLERSEMVAAYLEWSDEAEHLISERLPAAERHLFRSLPAPTNNGTSPTAEILAARIDHVRGIAERLHNLSWGYTESIKRVDSH